MAKYEIERKFLVNDESYKTLAEGNDVICQGYLTRRPEGTVRIRIKNGNGFLTVKGKTRGASREEYEYAVPVEDARRMLEMCEGNFVEKTRWRVPYAGHIWDVDEFGGDRKGLTVAEIELSSEDEDFLIPAFIGSEVTGDPQYYNSNL